MTPRGYDRLMLYVEIGGDRRVRRLDPAERWAYVAGVLALAAKSPERGLLLIADDLAVVAEDIAEQAGVKVRVASETLRKCRELGLVFEVEPGIEMPADWDVWNPEPKKKPSDSPENRRERKRLERERKRNSSECHASVTPRDTPDGHTLSRGEGKGSEGKEEPKGSSDTRTAEIKLVFDHWVKARDKHPSNLLTAKRATAIRARLREGYTVERLCRAIDGVANDPWEKRAENDGLEMIFRDVEKFEALAGAEVVDFSKYDRAAGL